MTDHTTTDLAYPDAPVHILASINRYVEHGLRPGSFVTAVLSNDLTGALLAGDEDSLRGLRDIMRYVHWEIPGGCHGSKSIVERWLKGQVEASPSGSKTRDDLLRNASVKTLGDYLDAEYDIGAAHAQREETT